MRLRSRLRYIAIDSCDRQVLGLTRGSDQAVRQRDEHIAMHWNSMIRTEVCVSLQVQGLDEFLGECMNK